MGPCPVTSIWARLSKWDKAFCQGRKNVGLFPGFTPDQGRWLASEQAKVQKEAYYTILTLVVASKVSLTASGPHFSTLLSFTPGQGLAGLRAGQGSKEAYHTHAGGDL